MHHPIVDFAKWREQFPIESFEDKEGTSITSPSELCQIELTRQRVGEKHDLGQPVPVDTIVWRHGPPDKPYLTKTGGVPHRERTLAWPTGPDGNPYTFVAQFCFLDSKDIVSDKLPGDVMLVFFRDLDSCFGDPGDIHIEWSSASLRDPCTQADCLESKNPFTVTELSAELHRCNEYPDGDDAFEKEGYGFLFATSQSTKIGRRTFYIQGDPRRDDQEQICALNSIVPADTWPFTNVENIPSADYWSEDGWGPYEMMLGDEGCMYFMIDAQGKVTWDMDCY